MNLNLNIDFQKVEVSTINDFALSGDNLLFLQDHGFLGWVSPHLYFGGFENNQLLPCLENWSWIKDWKVDKELALEKYGNWLVLGSGPDDEPLVMEPNKSPIYMISSNLELLLLNTNLERLATTASAFLDMVDNALKTNSGALLEHVIPTELTKEFISTFEALEGRGRNDGIWVQWANESSKNL